jgi:NAD(P)-dependent dehydrogenase (short-subunit alcohol dehydrogenase family)
MTDHAALTAEKLFNIKGWTCIVTGGGTGLGLMTANTLAANGAKVYITGRRKDKLQSAEIEKTSSGGSITAIQLDVTDKQSILDFAKQIGEKEKCVNLLVNNAGQTSVNYGELWTPSGDPKEVSERMLGYQGFDEWTGIYKVNVASIYFVSIAFLPLLCAARDQGHPEAGNIINISSISGITKESQWGQFSYNASKAATISLTEQLAVELKNPGLEVRVNTIAPGYFPSEMTPIDKFSSEEKKFFRERWGIPFGRAGATPDYAQAVLSLAVNQYVTGSTLVIDGGYLLKQP